ncbi:MAG: Y-family DNA polymerase [Gammaproteobacteria bacterium]|nr:Y-family DNA polymerase [Gammaproteobacteria bacterium]MDH5630034.1 Y-family DNA polymerase [Gammaproteobacteria bacterium]
MSRIIALCDVNNCFASAEAVFDPRLINKPLVVLSNNDGCAIARSKEAKQMQIKMGQPYFEIKHLQRKGLLIRSANFSLYTNLSERIRSILENLSPSVVPYSIDESFIDLSGIELKSLEEYGRIIKNTIYQQTSMPVGVGIAETKTLAKAANWAAKKYSKTNGIVNIAGDAAKRKRLLNIMPVNEIWGIGRALSRRLNHTNITTALELSQLNPSLIQQHYGVVLSRTIQELNGIEVLEWQPDYSLNKQIIASRSLSQKTGDRAILLTAIANHVSRGTKKLRAQQGVAKSVSVFLRTNKHIRKNDHHKFSCNVELLHPSSDNRLFLQAARKAFERIYSPHQQYVSCGIAIHDIVSVKNLQLDLFSTQTIDTKTTLLMGLLDQLNRRFGQGIVQYGSESVSRQWKSRSEWRSPDYTGNWDELPRVMG